MKSLFQLAGDVLRDLSRFVDRLAERVRGGKPLRCPDGDQLHPTDDPKGGTCSGCLAWQEEMRQEFYEDQAKAFPWWLGGTGNLGQAWDPGQSEFDPLTGLAW